MTDLILIGYLAPLAGGVYAERNGKACPLSGVELFKRTMPGLYAEDVSRFSADIKDTLHALSAVVFEEVNDFCRTHGLKGGGLFSRDSTPVLLVYYVCFGMFLRIDQLKATPAG